MLFFWIYSFSLNRFVCEDSIEKYILQVQAKKLSSAENALTGKKGTGSKLTIEDLKTLFGLEV